VAVGAASGTLVASGGGVAFGAQLASSMQVMISRVKMTQSLDFMVEFFSFREAPHFWGC
jgi:hypothetical protein